MPHSRSTSHPLSTAAFMPRVHFCRVKPAKALIPSHPSMTPFLPQQCQPPFGFWFRTSHWKARLTSRSSAYPNLTSARAVFPVRQSSLVLEPPVSKPPSGLANLSLHISADSASQGSSLVTPRSERIRSIQLVEWYFGL